MDDVRPLPEVARRPVLLVALGGAAIQVVEGLAGLGPEVLTVALAPAAGCWTWRCGDARRAVPAAPGPQDAALALQGDLEPTAAWLAGLVASRLFTPELRQSLSAATFEPDILDVWVVAGGHDPLEGALAPAVLDVLQVAIAQWRSHLGLRRAGVSLVLLAQSGDEAAAAWYATLKELAQPPAPHGPARLHRWYLLARQAFARPEDAPLVVAAAIAHLALGAIGEHVAAACPAAGLQVERAQALVPAAASFGLGRARFPRAAAREAYGAAWGAALLGRWGADVVLDAEAEPFLTQWWGKAPSPDDLDHPRAAFEELLDEVAARLTAGLPVGAARACLTRLLWRVLLDPWRQWPRPRGVGEGEAARALAVLSEACTSWGLAPSPDTPLPQILRRVLEPSETAPTPAELLRGSLGDALSDLPLPDWRPRLGPGTAQAMADQLTAFDPSATTDRHQARAAALRAAATEPLAEFSRAVTDRHGLGLALDWLCATEAILGGVAEELEQRAEQATRQAADLAARLAEVEILTRPLVAALPAGWLARLWHHLRGRDQALRAAVDRFADLLQGATAAHRRAVDDRDLAAAAGALHQVLAQGRTDLTQRARRLAQAAAQLAEHSAQALPPAALATETVLPSGDLVGDPVSLALAGDPADGAAEFLSQQTDGLYAFSGVPADRLAGEALAQGRRHFAPLVELDVEGYLALRYRDAAERVSWLRALLDQAEPLIVVDPVVLGAVQAGQQLDYVLTPSGGLALLEPLATVTGADGSWRVFVGGDPELLTVLRTTHQQPLLACSLVVEGRRRYLSLPPDERRALHSDPAIADRPEL